MSERLPELIAAHLDGTLTPEMRAELNELLRTDADARARFARAMRRETLVGEILRDARSAETVKPITRRRPSRRWRTNAPRTAAPWIAAAAAGLVVVLLVIFASKPTAPERVVRSPEPPPVERPRIEPPRIAPPAPVPAPRPQPEPVEAPKPAPPPTPLPPPPPPKPEPPTVPPPPPPAPTRTYVATVQSAEGEVPLKAGEGLEAGQGLEIGDGRAVVAFADGTRLELSAATKVRSFSDASGKRIDLVKGILTADVVKQPAGRPLVVATPHGEARVIGTTFRLVVDARATRLEVREGKVRLAGADGKSVDVAAGSYATAADLKPRALPVTLDPSLIGHWKFDEARGQTLLDSSFGAHDATLPGAVWGPGRHGAALRFDGVNDFALIEGRFSFPKNALTLSAWVKHESLPGKVQRYVVLRADELDLAVLRHDGADRARQLDFFVNANGFRHLRANDALTAGAWLHVAGSWDGRTQRLYLNGAEVARQETGGALAAREGSVVSLGVPREPMHGWIDDVRLYNRALTDKEIADLAGKK